MVDPTSTLVFLDICWPGSLKQRVYIRLNSDSSLAKQFVLLCIGQRGPSYRFSTFLRVKHKGEPGEGVVGDYQHNSGKGGAPLQLHVWPPSNHSCKAGVLIPCWSPTGARSAQFVITTKDQQPGKVYNHVFGEVVSGLEVVKAAVNLDNVRKVTVVNCGIGLNL
ncbi:hypothetical protein Pmani_013959 [Petrolisthes manimaculis]|uniref:PPIase cyclophilin-type domain-containing protein n=1 Tax=Petrolisthes manimaculis TaxID=1843537 RepID=A0AAE1PUI9_9EUCA|nr:hypothetical protein Pmani_013959 [Petrolisthes manimaculis]